MRRALIALCLGWLLINHEWIETTSRDKGICNFYPTWPGNVAPTMWACFWSAEPNSPKFKDPSRVFLDEKWDPVKDPIPLDWLRSTKQGAYAPDPEDTDPGMH
jgi:hypothetical protein